MSFYTFCVRAMKGSGKTTQKHRLLCEHSLVVKVTVLSADPSLHNINVLQQTACLVVNPIMVGNFAFLFNCTYAGGSDFSLYDGFNSKTYLLMRW